jgi:hypothetical protein
MDGMSLESDTYLFNPTALSPSIFQKDEPLSIATSPRSLSNTPIDLFASYKNMHDWTCFSKLLKCSIPIRK